MPDVPVLLPQRGLGAIWEDYKLPIILASVSLVGIAGSAFLFVRSLPPTEPVRFTTDYRYEASAGGRVPELSVDVEGAVLAPGVYRLPAGSRVGEAIEAAGGLTGDADAGYVGRVLNRAAKLVDGAKIYVPAAGQNTASGTVAGVTDEEVGTLVQINTASQQELEALPGIGPATAVKIINARPYQTLEELVSKKAMGQALFTKLKDQLTL